ncbi:MAG: HRDC domain-containing protein, partial [Pseudomonadota bacterium]
SLFIAVGCGSKTEADIWQRIRGVEKLNDAQLAAAQSLASWREEQAITRNTPRTWVLKDSAILEIARVQPADTDSLSGLQGIANSTVKNDGKAIVRIVAEAAGNQARPIQHNQRPVLNREQKALLDLLQIAAELIGREHGIDTENLASRKALEKLICGDASSALLQGWRKWLLGDKLDQVLRGEAAIELDPSGKLRIQ